MRVFVTGGTGLLGNTIVRQLSEQGHDVMALVRSEPDPAVFADTRAELVRGEIQNQELIDEAVQRCDVVIHSAGLIHLGWRRL
ncbi:MAG: NAD-dependent epimerase/dehydratase family protein, partial [Pirellulales bacterium]|nr:NAD-dependent epimerase/dehydratase family protein [Pirellulales bacterium]